MTFALYLMRHGIAEDFDPVHMRSDAERRLTKEGKEKLAAQAKAVGKLNLNIGYMLSSPYARAKETASIVGAELGAKIPLEITDDLLPNANPEAVLEELAAKKVGEPTMLFGHEPHLSTLAAFILGGRQDIAVEMKKGALCGFELARLAPPFRGVLRFLLPPRVLRGMT